MVLNHLLHILWKNILILVILLLIRILFAIFVIEFFMMILEECGLVIQGLGLRFRIGRSLAHLCWICLCCDGFSCCSMLDRFQILLCLEMLFSCLTQMLVEIIRRCFRMMFRWECTIYHLDFWKNLIFSRKMLEIYLIHLNL